MKKRILSILLLCCMVLTLLPTTAFAAETGAMDNIPAKFDVEIDLCNRTSDINIKDSKTYYIYSSSSDPDFVWTKKIQINGKKAAPHIFLDNVNIQVNKDAKTPAIELHGKASAYLYFINRDSKLTGATGRAAIQKNRSEGQLCVQVMEGTTVTCQGGYKAAGIGGSWATRNIAESLFNLDMYGHGANMHFGSQTNPSLWSGTIIAKGGDTISIDYDAGTVTVNGELLQEDYVAAPTYLGYDVQFPFTVPEGTLFVMGDNRNESLDSRSSYVGCIDERDILGKVLLCFLPVSDFGVVK